MMEKVVKKNKNGKRLWWDEDASVHVKPQKVDVLCGRGKTAFEHEGNRVLRVAIARNLPGFTAAKARIEKSKIVRSIIKAVLDRGGRFLKRARDKTDAWHVAGFSHAREKVSHALRDAAADKVKSMSPSRVCEMNNIADQKQELQDKLAALHCTRSTTKNPASPPDESPTQILPQSMCSIKNKIELVQKNVQLPPTQAAFTPSIQEKRPSLAASSMFDTFTLEFGEENHSLNSLNSDILDFYNDLAISDFALAEDVVSPVDMADFLLDSPLRKAIMIGEAAL